jgi:hypothetical protein
MAMTVFLVFGLGLIVAELCRKPAKLPRYRIDIHRDAPRSGPSLVRIPDEEV